jgi:hypothetical protein
VKKRRIFVLTIAYIVFLFLVANFVILNATAAEEEIEPDFGLAPEIDGDIERSKKEWENATKEEIHLKSSASTNPNDRGIPTDIWVMQNTSDLYISIQFELEDHKSEEFIAILISKDDSESNTSFYDAKLVQFYDLGGSNEDYRYRDFHIVNGQFFRDSEDNGDGAADLHGNKMIYEFRIPVNSSEEDDDDVDLEFGDTYAFKVVYGENDNYQNILNEKTSIVQIDIEYPKSETIPLWEKVVFILAIIAFGAIGGLYGLYIYKVLVIKKKIGRIKE